METERFEALIDAILAIIITIIVLEIPLASTGSWESLFELRYEFLIYAWKYVGIRPDIKFVPICKDEGVEQNILSILQYASEYAADSKDHTAAWDAMDGDHYSRWIEKKKEYVADVEAECNYRLEQQLHSFNQREAYVRQQIEAAKNDKIRRMREAQLENLMRKAEEQKKETMDISRKADIHTTLLVKGILHVGS